METNIYIKIKGYNKIKAVLSQNQNKFVCLSCGLYAALSIYDDDL